MTVRDQLGRNVSFTFPLRRIISLVPSQTELLYDLGLEDEVAGITKFCVHPVEWFKNKTRIGGTKTLNLKLIRQLQPDLIIGNKEENDQAQLEILMQEFPVWVSDIQTLQNALDMIQAIGKITGKKEKAFEIISRIKIAFNDLNTSGIKLKTTNPKPAAAYLIWRKPWMAAGKNTFIHEMLSYCGLRNCFADMPRYPEITLPQLKDKQCELILLSSEPLPFKQEHADEIRKILPEVKILFVDGEMFSWYGSRLLKSPAYFKETTDKIRNQF